MGLESPTLGVLGVGVKFPIPSLRPGVHESYAPGRGSAHLFSLCMCEYCQSCQLARDIEIRNDARRKYPLWSFYPAYNESSAGE